MFSFHLFLLFMVLTTSVPYISCAPFNSITESCRDKNIKLTEIITTNSGFIQGQVLKTVSTGIKYSAFKAIPYAKPPIGSRRFQPPEEVDGWTGVLRAVNESNPCPQVSMIDNDYTGDEDCLYLNVYTPQINSTDQNRHPVIVFYFGGGYLSGYINSSMYGPDFLLDEKVVVVAVNFRMGALGYLSLNHPEATGNMALKDQYLGLQWVKKNIHSFGGNRNKVTLLGHSSGGISIELLKLSRLTKGLFQNSISMSGSIFSGWAYHTLKQAKSRAFQLAQHLGISSKNVTHLLDKLRSFPARDIVMATKEMLTEHLVPFRPTEEDRKVAKTPMLTGCFINKYQTRNYTHLPHILGFVDSEILPLLYNPMQLEIILNQTLNSAILPESSNSRSAILKLRNLICTKNPKTLDDIDDKGLLYQAINITSELYFIHSVDETQKFLAANNSEIFYYRNSFVYPESLHRIIGINLDGTGHGDDLAHIFWIANRNQSLSPQSAIYKQRLRMVRMWTNFARYGNPTPHSTTDELLNVTWVPSGSEGYHLEINSFYSMGGRPYNLTLEEDLKLTNDPHNSDSYCSVSST